MIFLLLSLSLVSPPGSSMHTSYDDLSAETSCVPDSKIWRGANTKPAQWIHESLQENALCINHIATRTDASGYNDLKHRLGHRDTQILYPELGDAYDDLTIVYWLHGLNGYSKRTFDDRIIPQYFRSEMKVHGSLVMIVPEMPWSRFATPYARQGKVFEGKDEFYNYVQEVESIVLNELPGTRVAQRVVIGHSAGGSALKSAALEGSLCKVNIDLVVFSDASYGKWFQDFWTGCTPSNKRKVIVLLAKYGKPWFATQKIRKLAASSDLVEFWDFLSPWTHKKIGDNAFPIVLDDFPDLIYYDWREKGDGC